MTLLVRMEEKRFIVNSLRFAFKLIRTNLVTILFQSVNKCFNFKSSRQCGFTHTDRTVEYCYNLQRVGSFFTVLIFQRGFLCEIATDRHLDKFHLTDEQIQHFTTYNYTTRREGTSRVENY